MQQIKFILLVLMMVSWTTAAPSLPSTNSGQATQPLQKLNSLFDNYNLNQGKNTFNSLSASNNGIKADKESLHGYNFDLGNQNQRNSDSQSNNQNDFSFINAMQNLVQSNSHYFNTNTKEGDKQGNNNFVFGYQETKNQPDNSNQEYSYQGFNQNHGNKDQDNKKDDKKDDKNEDDPYEKMKEDYKDFLKEEEKKEAVRVRDAQRWLMLTIPFFLYDKPTAAYFGASELLSVAFEKIGISDEYNLILMLFVQCVDIVALKQGRFKLVEGYKVNWYQELMDIGMSKAGFTDLLRVGLLMMMPQSPKPTYEGEVPLEGR